MRLLGWVRTTVFALPSVLLATPALAQTSEPAAPAGDVIWIMRPAIGRIPDGATRISLRVDLRCTVRSGRLTACAAVGPAVEGFAQSAIEAAGRAHVAVEDTLGVATEGREIVVPIGFPIPVAIDPPPAPPSSSRLTHVVWLEQPDAEDFIRLYPPRAWQEGMSGQVTLDCIVAGNGQLSCAVTAEDPVGYGFGDATLRLAREWRVAPATSAGEATAGGRIGRTIRWRAEPLQNQD